MENRPSLWFPVALLVTGGFALPHASRASSPPTTDLLPFSVARIDLGGAPQRIEAADFDGDGDTDLVVLSSSLSVAGLALLRNEGDDSVVAPYAPSATRGSGAGHASPAVLQTPFTVSWVADLDPPVINLPPDLEVGDLDGDGDLDLLTNIRFSSSNMTSRLNAGDGTFDRIVGVPLFAPRVENELADLDGNGVVDNSYHEVDIIGYVGTSEGNGDGSFQFFGPIIASASGDEKLRTALGEVTGDALLDLVMASISGLELARGMAGTPIPGWKHPVEEIAVGSYADVTLADLDEDGATDVIATRPSLGRVTVLLGLPGGGFGSPIVHSGPPSPDAVTVADVDGDSVLDVVTTHVKRGLVSVFRGLGSGALLPPESFFVTQFPSDVVATDLDADGDVDLAVTDFRQGTVVLLFNRIVP